MQLPVVVGPRSVLAVAALLLVMVALPALAEDKEKASALNGKAIEAYRAEEYLQAIDLWLEATEYADREQLIKLHKNLGLALYKLERLAEAWYHFATYMQQSEKTDAKVARRLQELEKDLAKVHRKISVSTQPPGALAILPPGDRMHRFKTPFSYWLPPGEYAMEFRLAGHVTGRQTVRVRMKGRDRFNFVLAPEPTRGTLKLVGADPDGSSVRINGKVQGPLPYEADLPPGQVSVAVYWADGRSFKRQVMVEKGKVTQLEVQASAPIEKAPAEVEKSGGNGWKWALVGGGLALVAGGGILTGVGISNHNTRYDEVLADWQEKGLSHTTPTDDPLYLGYREDYDAIHDEEVQPYLVSSYVLYGLGGAALVTGVVTLLLDDGPDEPSAAAFSVRPALGAGQAGFDLEFRF